MSSGELLPPALLGVLGEGRQAYVAVASSRGPHVTPELYAWSGDRLWFAAASSTLKAKVLQRDPSVGVVVNVAGRSVILTGQVEVLDPRSPTAVLAHLPRLPRTVRALASYTTRNAADLLAFVGDAASGKLGHGVPPVRLLFSVAPQRLALVENDVLAGHWGWDGGTSTGPDGRGSSIPAGGARAVAGLPGPLAVPGRWFARESSFHLAGPLARLAGVGDVFPVSVVVDDYSAPGPAAKTGALVRGEGRLGEDGTTITVEPERVVEWDGVETSSTDAS